MHGNIELLFKGLTTASEITALYNKILRWKKGSVRLLLEEIKGNMDLCWMVIEEGTDPKKVIPSLETKTYDRLLENGFDFDKVSRIRRRGRKIQSRKELEESDLRYFIGKSTEELIQNIYDKVKELKRRYKIDRNNEKIQWKRREINLSKRILLLMDHLEG